MHFKIIQMKPFFSVIIPLYNKEAYILATLESALAQNFRDFEIIIVNDGSTDQSVARAQRITDARIHILHQKNQGVSVARNHGIAAAKGKYIALLDADDLWLPNHLEGLQHLITKFPKAGLYCSRYAIKYTEHYTKDIIFSAPVAAGMSIIKDYFAASLLNPVAWTSAVAFRKTAFEKLGGFDPKLRTAEDMDLFIRFVLHYKVAFNATMTMIYLKNTSNLSLAKVEYNDDRDYFVNKYVKEEATNNSLKKYLDQNRFAIAIRSKIVGHVAISKKQVRDINPKNLNLKQSILLKLPRFALQLFAKTHHLLIKNKIYIKPLR